MSDEVSRSGKAVLLMRLRLSGIRWNWIAALSTAVIIGVAIWQFGYRRINDWVVTPEFVAAATIAMLFVLWAMRGQPPSAWSIVTTGGAAYFSMWVMTRLDRSRTHARRRCSA